MTFTVGFGIPVLPRLRFSPNRSQIAQPYVTSYIKSAWKEGENAAYPSPPAPSPPAPPALLQVCGLPMAQLPPPEATAA